jgi:hypothetical protein
VQDRAAINAAQSLSDLERWARIRAHAPSRNAAPIYEALFP